MDTIFRQPGKTGIGINAEYSAGFKNGKNCHDSSNERKIKMKFNSVIFCLCAGMCSTVTLESMNLNMRFNTVKGIDFDEEDPFKESYKDNQLYSQHFGTDLAKTNNRHQNSNDSLEKEWHEHIETMEKLGIKQNLNEDWHPSINVINDIFDEEICELEYIVHRTNEGHPEGGSHDNQCTTYAHYYKKKPKKTCCVIL